MKHNAKSSEHYLPRAAYLRHFSDTADPDDRKNVLSVFNVQTKSVRNSTVYREGYENKLYEGAGLAVNKVEDFLAEIEKDFVAEISRLIAICSSSANNNALILHGKDKKDNLRFFLTLQHFRTPKTRDEYDCDERDRQEIFLGGIVGKNENGKWWIKHNADKLINHYFVFERNETGIPFAIADQPVLIFKSAEEEQALNFRFPLSSWLQVLVIDPNSSEHKKHYQYRNRLRIIPSGYEQVIHVWNQRAIENAKRFVFFDPRFQLDQSSDSKTPILAYNKPQR